MFEFYKRWPGFVYLLVMFYGNNPAFSAMDLILHNCTLFVNWDPSSWNNSCSRYLVTLNENEGEGTKNYSSSLAYLKAEVTSRTKYNIVVSCEVKSTTRLIRNISTIPTMTKVYITEKESKNLTINCPFQGAYISSKPIIWEHVYGVEKNTSLRIFESTQVNLFNVSYRDLGAYYCTVRYTECNDSPLMRQTTGFVFVTIQGPPAIVSSRAEGNSIGGCNLHIQLQVLSFPEPKCSLIVYFDSTHHLMIENCTISPKVMYYTLYGKYIDAYGYLVSFDVMNMTEEIGRQSDILTIFLENNEGPREYKMYIETKNNTKKGKSNSNVLVISYTTGGFLCIITVVAVTAVLSRKMRGTCSCLNTRKRETIENKLDYGKERNPHILADYTSLRTYEVIW